MRRRRAMAAVLACALVGSLGAARSQAAEDLARYVDPFIGTLGSGFVFPGPAAPYGMVQLSPDTEGFFAYTGYLWTDQFIRGFSHVHVESMGVPEGGNVPFMPTTGAVVTDVRQYQSKFDHANEEASAGYYRVSLQTYGIEAELTAGLRVGMHRYTFPATTQANVLIDAGRQIPGGSYEPPAARTPGIYSATVQILPDQRTVLGTANPNGTDKPQHYAVHFAARFDRPFASYGVWSARGAAPQPGVASAEGKGAGAFIAFDATEDRDVVVKVGISFVSQANALANLESELPAGNFGFDGLRARTRSAWNDALHAIEVTGGSDADKISFYTALYHAQHHPNVFNDVSGEYIGHPDPVSGVAAVHRIGALGDPMPAGSTYYANFSLWDTYRAEKPLLALIAPDRFRDFMRSFAAIVATGGRLPRWSLMNIHADFMNGEPALQVFADGFCRGLVPEDVLDVLYQDARRLALVDRRNPAYLTRGWVDPSTTLEHALGDFALALVADRLGQVEDRDRLLRQAAFWGNVFDDETRFVRPRNADGSWMTPYLPESDRGFVEGTGWQYTWLVPQDVRGLFDRMGAPPYPGDPFVQQRLDEFFSTALTGTVPLVMPEVQQKLTLYGILYAGNQYAPSNEHDLQAPWLHNWVGEPWKTQALARAYQGLYRPLPDGLPGNDDLGTMSAWYIWSALGFYPVIPGSPVYTIGSPVFERATVRLPGGETFVVRASGASPANKYVQSAKLGRSKLAKTWFTHDALVDQGTLRLQMGPVPNTSWGTGPGAAPPSMSTNPLSDFACTP